MADSDIFLSRVGQRYNIFHSICMHPNGTPDSGSGDVLAFSWKQHSAGWNVEHFVEIPGRAFRFCVEKETDDSAQSLECFGVHKWGLSRNQVTRLTTAIGNSVDRSSADPTNLVTFLVGDLNIPPAGSQPLPLSDPARLSVRNCGSQVLHVAKRRPFQAIWERLFAKFREIEIPEHTHLNVF